MSASAVRLLPEYSNLDLDLEPKSNPHPNPNPSQVRLLPEDRDDLKSAVLRGEICKTCSNPHTNPSPTLTLTLTLTLTPTPTLTLTLTR
jgi:hypothetical protein